MIWRDFCTKIRAWRGEGLRAGMSETSKPLDFWIFGRFEGLIFGIFGCLDFWMFGFLEHLFESCLPTTKHPKIQRSKHPNIPKMQRSKHPKIQTFGSCSGGYQATSDSASKRLGFWMFVFLDFWIFGGLAIWACCCFGCLNYWFFGCLEVVLAAPTRINRRPP